MKKRTGILVAGLLAIGLVGGIFAQTDTDNHDVDVVIADITLIDVSDATVTLNLTTTVAGQDLQSDSDNSATLSFSHNQSTNQEITAVASLNSGDPSDITLTVDVNSEGAKTLVNGGSIQAAQVVRDNFAAGAYSGEMVEYSAGATLAGSTPGTRSYQILYTIQDDA